MDKSTEKTIEDLNSKLSELDEAIFDYELDDVKEDLNIIKKYLQETDPKFAKMYKEEIGELRKPIPLEDEIHG